MSKLSGVLASGVFCVIGVALTVVALVVLPIYGAFMVVWLHVPLPDILVTVGPLVVIFGVGAFATFRASARACKGGA